MNKLSSNSGRLQRKRRVRAKISGSASRPRLAVFKSLKGIYVQVIDDTVGKTLASANLAEIKKAANTIEGAKEVGKLIAKKCVALKIESVTFDRAGYQYHGKVKSLADGAREGGLQF
ncbi:MAG TPA: 50S ribosomal protein L18 [Candidatus Moranbacteria bacterium]|nr:MAG: ribosomal protein L18, large subunit ribosomal protein L18 [Parcubacteria group bacterium GW2011_GWC1_36_108]KKQ00471.1 MAG: 50S ribosomal protein L18 [Candidatus Moranbacteria bacterium GW2011_GWD1_36_198]KKQ01703.1 MAG: 50S ribosomal protein L18 [Candidatus Moranbacteria bacterium GW2011_GWD2_36_198]KKQ39612.1 MAG: 50S ribosomal protein L18 [Candidatus Moranbacteria bacterium GW2011_GWC2_37_73]MDD5463882.1 50S ribosomal protein L18 [Candidatus Moranbacteria bacterium]